MNSKPAATTVLCYGDSNTYGQNPDKIHRYDADTRWPGRLQQLLGSDFYVIEEGLGSRTTDLDYAKKPGRNGKTYFVPCLQSHNPLDIVVIMLGTNDLKLEYNRPVEAIGEALSGLVDDLNEYAVNLQNQAPKIILVSPAALDENASRFAELYTDYYDANSVQKSKDLGGAIAVVAEKHGCTFFDAATVAKAGDDGVHWDESSHIRFAEALAPAIRGQA